MHTEDGDTDGYISITDAAQYAGVTTETIRAWVRAGHLPAVQLPGRGLWRIRRTDLNAAIKPVKPRRDAGDA